MRTHSRLALILFLCLACAACEQPPAKEIAAAESALQQARQDGADIFTPDRFGEAQAALADAHKKVQAKDYRGALSSATDAAEKSRAASQAAQAAKALARNAAEVAEAEVQAALDEVAEIRAQAAKAKIPENVFEDLLPQVTEASSALDGMAKALADGNLLEAQKLATELKAKVTPLPGLFREAQAKWEAQHPKSRRPRRR
jgi:hypothetical protein